MSNFAQNLKEKLAEKARAVANRVQAEVAEFEEKGGMRGAFERVRVKSESRMKDIAAALEQRGINIGKLLPSAPEDEDTLHAHYKTLGVPFDSDYAVVKAAYRDLMRKYHPDRHAQDPTKERAATEMARKIALAYEAIERYLKARGPR